MKSAAGGFCPALLLAACLSPSYASAAAATLPILVYHQIRSGPEGPPDGMTVISAERFAEQMRWLHEQGYATLSMDEVVKFLKGKKFPARAVAIHFDDGWRSALTVRPVLERYGFKATFWSIVGSPGTGDLFIDWPGLRALDESAAFEVFSHTMTHPYEAGNTLADWIEGKTPGKGAADVRWELERSKRVLEEKLAHPVPYLDWPAGVSNEALVAAAVQAGYTALVTTIDEVNRPGGDPLSIRRTVVNGACGEADFRAILADGKYRGCEPPVKK